MRLYAHITMVLVLCFGAVSSASAILINDGFEEPVIKTGKAEDFDGIPGWNLVAGGKFTIHSDFEAAEGEQFLELNADKDASGDIFQATNTTAGVMYNLDFFYSLPLLPKGKGIPNHANSDTAGAFGFLIGSGEVSSDFQFLIADILITGGKKLEAPEWQFFSVQFEAQAKSSTIFFRDQENSGYLIDGASLTAVPEPATMLLLLLGLMGLAGIGRSKFTK